MNTRTHKTSDTHSRSVAASLSHKKGEADDTTLPLQGMFEAPTHETGGAPGTVPAWANRTGLPDNLKAGVEALSGYTMNDVKVHYNSAKPAQLQAHAYAQGTDIHVAPGQERHLPHEAWHVVQQKQGRVKPTTQLKGKVTINDDAGLEKEADIMGRKALQQKAKEPTGSNIPVPFHMHTGLQNNAIQRLVVTNAESDKAAADEIDPKKHAASVKYEDTLAALPNPKVRILTSFEEKLDKEASNYYISHSAEGDLLGAGEQIGTDMAGRIASDTDYQVVLIMCSAFKGEDASSVSVLEAELKKKALEENITGTNITITGTEQYMEWGEGIGAYTYDYGKGQGSDDVSHKIMDKAIDKVHNSFKKIEDKIHVSLAALTEIEQRNPMLFESDLKHLNEQIKGLMAQEKTLLDDIAYSTGTTYKSMSEQMTLLMQNFQKNRVQIEATQTLMRVWGDGIRDKEARIAQIHREIDAIKDEKDLMVLIKQTGDTLVTKELMKHVLSQLGDLELTFSMEEEHEKRYEEHTKRIAGSTTIGNLLLALRALWEDKALVDQDTARDIRVVKLKSTSYLMQELRQYFEPIPRTRITEAIHQALTLPEEVSAASIQGRKLIQNAWSKKKEDITTKRDKMAQIDMLQAEEEAAPGLEPVAANRSLSTKTIAL